MTVGGDRETHCGQELLVYHQGVRQGAETCRQGLALQIIPGRSRVGSTPRGETGSVRTLLRVSCVHTPTFNLSTVWSSMRLSCSHGTLRWRLKSLCQTTRTRMGSLTVSLTPSLNPKMTLTKFWRHVTRRVSVYFFIFYLHILVYFLSAEPVHTDSTRSSLNPCFFVRHFNFWDVYS
jgi:hypothetical protein